MAKSVAMTVLSEASEDELACVRELRKLVGNADPLSTDLKLLQFVRARESDVAKAEIMHSRWLSFREEYGLDHISANDVQREVATGKAMWHGHDKKNRPCCVIFPKLHVPSESTEEEICRFVLYMLHEGVRRADALGSERVCVLYDRRGMTRKNFDRKLFSLAQKLVDIVQVCYAERLGAVYVVGANWFYWALWKIISPFLSDVTKRKIFIIGDPRELLTHFEAKQLDPSVFTGAAESARRLHLRAGCEARVEVWMSKGQTASFAWNVLPGSVLWQSTTVDFAHGFDEDAGDEAVVAAMTEAEAEDGSGGAPPPPISGSFELGEFRSVTSCAGEQILSFSAPADGTLHLVFSNRLSRMRAKRVQYTLHVEDTPCGSGDAAVVLPTGYKPGDVWFDCLEE